MPEQPDRKNHSPAENRWPWQFAPAPHQRIIRVPAFDDNYLWLLTDEAGRQAVVVDPGDEAAIEAALAAHGLTLVGILVTHHHADHIGGVTALAGRWHCPVYGPASEPERIAQVTEPLRDGQIVDLPAIGVSFEVLTVPGHTLGHIAYFAGHLGDDPRGVLFCGDTLFAAGCGRMFEGQPAQMQASLARLAALPGDTLVYCAHEYTIGNLHFALAAEPGSAVLAGRFQEATEMRRQGLPTVPFVDCHRRPATRSCGPPSRQSSPNWGIVGRFPRRPPRPLGCYAPERPLSTRLIRVFATWTISGLLRSIDPIPLRFNNLGLGFDVSYQHARDRFARHAS
ncbi:MAG: hydroxyacylglutathione hydrolase [Burkholderiaceae bacterium]